MEARVTSRRDVSPTRGVEVKWMRLDEVDLINFEAPLSLSLSHTLRPKYRLLS